MACHLPLLQKEQRVTPMVTSSGDGYVFINHDRISGPEALRLMIVADCKIAKKEISECYQLIHFGRIGLWVIEPWVVVAILNQSLLRIACGFGAVDPKIVDRIAKGELGILRMKIMTVIRNGGININKDEHFSQACGRDEIGIEVMIFPKFIDVVVF